MEHIPFINLPGVSRPACVVSVGFEYESCPDLILWEKRTAVLQGYETTASKLGGWTLDKHHALNIQSGESTDCPFVFIHLFIFNLPVPSGTLIKIPARTII